MCYKIRLVSKIRPIHVEYFLMLQTKFFTSKIYNSVTFDVGFRGSHRFLWLWYALGFANVHFIFFT
jgi:hypothetical protein